MCHMFPVCCLSGCFTCVSRQWLKSEDIQRISLFFHNKTLEKEVGECIATSNQQPASSRTTEKCQQIEMSGETSGDNCLIKNFTDRWNHVVY